MERVRFFEITQPICSLRYGVGACPAVLGADSDAKCFNTLATCPVPDSFDETTLTLRFALEQEGLLQYGNVLPCMTGLDIAPAVINIAGMDRSAAALGERETGTVTLTDFQHSDHQVDPYRLERATGAAMAGSPVGEGYDPYERGTFWGKWLARNPYYTNYACAVREGELGQALEDMTVRHYVIDTISGPSNGRVQIRFSDTFSLIEKRKAVAPLASEGELAAAIDDVQNSAQLSPAGIGALKYPTSGRVQIGDEVMAFTRAGDALTFTARGDLGTTASDHDEEDLVQIVYQEESQLAQDIIYRLLTEYSEIDPAAIDKDAWDAATATVTQLYTGYVGSPTPVQDLIGELEEQAGLTVFPNVITGMIEMLPLRPRSPTALVDDDNLQGAVTLIVDNSLQVKRDASKRASEVWVYYGIIDPAQDLTQKRNYRSRVVVADGNSSYDVPQIREVFSRWIPQFGRTFALDTGNRILAEFRDAPWEAAYAIHASREGDLALGQPYSLRTDAIQDITGDKLLHAHIVTSLERDDDMIRVTSQQARYYTEASDTGTRTIYIDSDAQNLNLRTVHDQLYSAPVEGSPGQSIVFVITAGVVVGSASALLYAVDTGDWPASVQLSIECDGRIAGCGGKGGNGAVYPAAGSDGQDGGTALRARFPVVLSGDGTVAAGGGGGGGGGGAGLRADNRAGGGGGGGGGGNSGGVPGVGGASNANGYDGAAGTLEAGGAFGAGGYLDSFYNGGRGGDGGDPGAAGEAGQAAKASPFGGSTTAPGAGGNPGLAIEGVAFVTYSGSPSVVVIGSTS